MGVPGVPRVFFNLSYLLNDDIMYYVINYQFYAYMQGVPDVNLEHCNWPCMDIL